MSQPDLKTTKRYYRSFMEWAQVCAPMQYMSMGLRTASKEEILGLIREWAETITRKETLDLPDIIKVDKGVENPKV
jgi:hypothetical protein